MNPRDAFYLSSIPATVYTLIAAVVCKVFHAPGWIPALVFLLTFAGCLLVLSWCASAKVSWKGRE